MELSGQVKLDWEYQMASFQIVSQSQRCGDLATYTDVTRCGLRIMNLIAPVKKGQQQRRDPTEGAAT